MAGAESFDFLVGRWRVHHHRLVPGTDDWVDFEGTASNREVMGGAANIEEHALDAPAGAYRALALRSYDPRTDRWAIWWLDDRYPAGPVGPPVVGSFEGGEGHFYADDELNGSPIRLRFRWSDITPVSARWEQAFSFDGGATWAVNWVMNFRRDTASLSAVAGDHREPSDFDFLEGDWRVHHRYLRATDSGRVWSDADGTVRHSALMAGRANIDEYLIHTADGTHHALALRSYDRDISGWWVWWLDGRTPHEDIGPPMRGHFENGVGTFHGETTIDGRPVGVRFIWSRITKTSARWEQAYAGDREGTWETNWMMDFQRA